MAKKTHVDFRAAGRYLTTIYDVDRRSERSMYQQTEYDDPCSTYVPIITIMKRLKSSSLDYDRSVNFIPSQWKFGCGELYC